MPPAVSTESPGKPTLMYVPGGNQRSLETRFAEASTLYRRGIARKIHILSRPGITEYSPELGRNLTNDEWSARELEKHGVNGGDVVPVYMSPSFFGTLREALVISEMVRKKGYGRLVLVSSRNHTRRLYDTFKEILGDERIELYVYGAGGNFGLSELASEYVKLLAYDHLVLPIRNWRRHGTRL